MAVTPPPGFLLYFGEGSQLPVKDVTLNFPSGARPTDALGAPVASVVTFGPHPPSGEDTEAAFFDGPPAAGGVEVVGVYLPYDETTNTFASSAVERVPLDAAGVPRMCAVPEQYRALFDQFGYRFDPAPSPSVDLGAITADDIPDGPQKVVMSRLEQLKLDSIETEATKNLPDEELLDLANATGTLDPARLPSVAIGMIDVKVDSEGAWPSERPTEGPIRWDSRGFPNAVPPPLAEHGDRWIHDKVEQPGSQPQPGQVATLVATPQGSQIEVTWTPPTGDPGTATRYVVAQTVPGQNPPTWTSTPQAASARSMILTNQQFGGFPVDTDVTITVTPMATDGTLGTSRSVVSRRTAGSTLPPGGTVEGPAMDPPARIVGLYHMMYDKSTYPKLATTPPNVNVLYLAFAFKSPPQIAGYAAEGGAAGWATEAAKLRARGVRMVMSIGGQGNAANLTDRAGWINFLVNFHKNVAPIDGLDIDLEGHNVGTKPANQPYIVGPNFGKGSDGVYHIVAIVQGVRAAVGGPGSKFFLTMAPQGGDPYNHAYVPVAKAASDAGLLAMIGKQLYENGPGPSPYGDVSSTINFTKSAGIPESKIGIGMMQPPTSYSTAYWTVDTAISRMNQAFADYPALRGGYLWEASRAGTADWANRVGGIIKSKAA